MARMTVNGVALNVLDRGAGDPPFVFIHGFACDHTAWLPQVEDLSRDHRCLAIDLRGRGGSEAKPPYDVTTAADDVAAIMRSAGLGPAIVVGHSLGGAIALLVNWRHPELVLATVMGDSPLSLRGLPQMGQSVREAGSTEPLRTMVEGFFTDATASDIREQVRKMMLSCPPEVAAGMVENEGEMGEQREAIFKAADKKPFMALWAGKPIGSPEKLRELTVFVRQERVSGTGHFFQMEKPAVTNALLRAFLDDVERDPRVRRAG